MSHVALYKKQKEVAKWLQLHNIPFTLFFDEIIVHFENKNDSIRIIFSPLPVYGNPPYICTDHMLTCINRESMKCEVIENINRASKCSSSMQNSQTKKLLTVKFYYIDPHP